MLDGFHRGWESDIVLFPVNIASDLTSRGLTLRHLRSNRLRAQRNKIPIIRCTLGDPLSICFRARFRRSRDIGGSLAIFVRRIPV